MINDLPWRKFPRDAIRNEELDYIAFSLGEELAVAPYMFFMTMYCRADDDGVFDIADGCIFSRLMRIGTPQDVIQIAQLFVERGIISPVIEGQSLFLINDWEVPNRPNVVKAKTAEERRAAVARKIKDEQQKRQAAQTVKDVYVKFPTQQELNKAFFCPVNDKNTDFVAKTEREERQRLDIDSRQTNTDRQTTEIGENFFKREIENRHTQESNFRRQDESLLQLQENQTQQEVEKHKELEELANQAVNYSDAGCMTNGNKAENTSRECGDEMQKVVILEAVKQFFAKNCKGMAWSPEEDKAMKVLSNRFTLLADNKNSPDIVATVYLTQFKQLTEQGYFKNMPLLPSYAAKKEIFNRISSMASKILFHGNVPDVFEEQAQFKKEAERDFSAVGNEIEQQCVKYGIDPNSKDRMSKLLIAKETAIK